MTVSLVKGVFHPMAILLVLFLLVFPCCEIKTGEKTSAAIKTEEPAGPAEAPRTMNPKDTRLTTIPEAYGQWSNVTFSADGKQVFYTAIAHDAQFVVSASPDGESISPAFERVSFMAASADGRRFAFGGVRKGKKHLVVDNRELKDLNHEEVAPSSFSPDGRFVACEVGGMGEKRWFIVLSDGENVVYRSQVYPESYRQPVFSPDGRLLVFELGDDKAKTQNNTRNIFFFDTSIMKVIKQRTYSDSALGKIAFSPGSARFLYEMRKGGKNFLVLQDIYNYEERTVEIPFRWVSSVSLSPDGSKILYLVTKEGKHYLDVSSWTSPAQTEEEIGPYDSYVPPNFGPESKLFAYQVIKDGKWRAMIGSREGLAKYDGVGGSPLFSPDGEKIAYPAMMNGGSGATSSKWMMVVSPSDNPSIVREGPPFDIVVTPVFSPDGRRIAYRVRTGTMEKGRRFIVIADATTGRVIKKGTAGEEIWPPVWSADGKAVGYGARIGRELWWKVEHLDH